MYISAGETQTFSNMYIFLFRNLDSDCKGNRAPLMPDQLTYLFATHTEFTQDVITLCCNDNIQLYIYTLYIYIDVGDQTTPQGQM